MCEYKDSIIELLNGLKIIAECSVVLLSSLYANIREFQLELGNLVISKNLLSEGVSKCKALDIMHTKQDGGTTLRVAS